MSENNLLDPKVVGISKDYLISVAKYFGEEIDTNLVWEDFVRYTESTHSEIEYSVGDNSLTAILLYRLAKMSHNGQKILSYASSITGITIDISAKLGKVKFDGTNIYIGENVEVGDYTTISQNVSIKRKNNSNLAPRIGKNCIIYDNAKVIGDIDIGDNVIIYPNAVVLGDVPSDCKVIVSSNLQYRENIIKNILPMQKLVVYGLFPRWKNTLVIEGSGIYNPTVLIKCQSEINFHLDYWDKNKIILKVVPTKIDNDILERVKIIVLSNSDKVILSSVAQALSIALR